MGTDTRQYFDTSGAPEGGTMVQLQIGSGPTWNLYDMGAMSSMSSVLVDFGMLIFDENYQAFESVAPFRTARHINSEDERMVSRKRRR